MERGGLDMAERAVNRELRERFAGAAERAVLLRPGDDPAIEPGQLMVRVFVEVSDEQGLAAWQEAHQTAMREFRRGLSLRLPSPRLLRFTLHQPGAARVLRPHDAALAAGRTPGRRTVTPPRSR